MCLFPASLVIGQKPKAHYYFTFWNCDNFGFKEFFVGSTGSDWTTHGSSANQKNNHFSGSILKCFFNEILHGHCNLLEFKFVNSFGMLHGHEKWAYFYVLESKNGHFSVFSTVCSIKAKFRSRSSIRFLASFYYYSFVSMVVVAQKTKKL